MSNITVDFAQYTADTTLNGPYNASDTVTLADDSSVLDALSDSDIDGLATNNVDVISATDGVLSWTADQYSHLILGPVTIDPDTFAIMADTGADIAALSATQIGEIAAEGVAVIDPSDSMLTLGVDQFNALGAMSVDASANFTIADTGANLAGMSAGQIASLASLGVDHLDATDDMLSLTVAQYQALGAVTLTAADIVTLADTGASLNALTLSDYSGLHAGGIDAIDATDNAFNISLAEFNALNGVTLAAGDTITLADTGATIGALTTGQIDTLATGGIDVFNATDTALSLSIAQYNETVTDSISLTSGNTVTLADTGTNLAALSTAQIDALVNIDAFHATDNALTISAAQYTHLVSDTIALTAGDSVTVSDTAATLSGLTFSSLAGNNVDFLDSTTAYTTLTVAQLTALGAVAFTGASAVTLTDSGANIAAVSDFSTFSAHGVDVLDANDASLTISEAQFQALGSTTLTAGDTVTIHDTFANIGGGAGYSTLAAAGIDYLDATTAVNVTVANITDLGTVVFTPASSVTLLDSGTNIAGQPDFTIFASHGVDTIDATNDVLTINVTQYGGLGAVTLTAADVVTISDIATNLATLSFGTLVGANVDFLNSTNAYTKLTVAQLNTFGTLAFTAGSSVTLTDTSAAIQGVSDFSTFATHGVDTLDASDDMLTLTVTQYSSLGTTHLTGLDVVTIADTAANLQAYLGGFASSATLSTALSTNGIDTIHATGGSLTVNASETSGVLSSGAVFAAGDTVTLADSSTNILGLSGSFASLGALGIDTLDATDDVLSLTVDQYNSLTVQSIGLTASDTVTLADTGIVLAGLSAGQITALVNIDIVDATDDAVSFSIAQLNALSGKSIQLTAADTVTLSDSEANVEALTAAQFTAYANQGVDFFDPVAGLNLNASQIAAVVDSTAAFTASQVVTLVDTSANIAALTVTEFGLLSSKGVDKIDATTELDLSVAKFQAIETVLHSAALTLTNPAVLSDTGAHIDALTTTEIGQLFGDNVTTISASSEVDWTQAQVAALGSATISFTGGNLHLTDTEATIEGLSTAAIDADHAAGVAVIHATDHDVLNFTVAQAQHIIAGGMSVSNSTVTVTDTGANVSSLTTGQLGGFGGAGINEIVVTSGDIVWTAAQLNADTVDTIKATGGHFELSDTEAHIEANTASDFTRFINQGVDIIHASDTGLLTLSLAEVETLFNKAVFAGADTVTVADSSTNIDALTASDIGKLASINVDVIDAADNIVNFSVAQYNALAGTISLTAGDTVTLVDTGAQLQTLNFALLAAANVDALDASDNMLTITAAQYSALGSVHLTAADTVTISDTVSHIGGLNFSVLAAANVDVLDVTGGSFSLNVSRYTSLGAVAFSSASTVTLFDTGANIAALTAGQIGGLAAHGIDFINANDNVLSLTVAQYNALGSVALTANDAVTIADTGATLATLNFAQLAANNVDFLDATDNVLSLTVAKYQSLGTVHLTAADTVTLADTGANIAALTSAQFAALAGNGIDKIDATNNVLTLSVAQYGALGAVTLTGADSVTLLDTGANLQTLDFSTLASKGIDILDASDNVLTLTADQFASLGTVALKSTDTVTLLDTGAHISSLTVGQFNALAAKGIDILDATDNAYTLTVAKVTGISPALSLAANDTITLQDTEANIEGMSGAQIAAAIARGIDIIHANSGHMSMTAVQVAAVLGTGAVFFAADTVTLADTGAAIGGLTATQFGELAGAGVDKIDASDDMLTINLDQYRALGTVTLTGADTVTIRNDNNGISAMTVAEVQALSANGIDVLESMNSNFSFSAAQADALVNQTGGGHVALSASDTFYVNDTGANISALSAADITAFGALGAGGVDLIGSGAVTFSLAQYNAAVTASVTIDAGDDVTLSDTGAAIAALTAGQIGALAGHGIDHIDASDDAITFTVAQALALGAVTLTAADVVTVADTEANIEALTNANFHTLNNSGVDIIHSTNGILNLSVAQVGALLATSTHFASADTVTLVDAGATISALGTAQFGVLGSTGVDVIDASDNLLTLSVGQFNALGTVTLTAGDTVTLADTGSTIGGLTAATIQGLANANVDVIDASDNGYSLTVAQAHALVNQTGGGHVSAAATDTIYVNDTGANLSALAIADLTALGAEGASSVQLFVNDGQPFDMSIAFFSAMVAATVSNQGGNNTVLTDTGSALTTFLTPSNITALHANNVDSIDASNDAISLTKVQLDNLSAASLALTPADTVTFQDSEVHIEALTGAQFTSYITQGVDVFHSNSGILALNESQVAPVVDAGASFKASDAVTLADTAADIQLLTATEFGQLASHGVDVIDITSGTLSLSVADYQALGTFSIVGGTATLVDTGADIATLTSTQLGALTGTAITKIDATDNVLSLNVAQATAILHQTNAGTVSLAATDAVTIADTGAAIGAMSAADLTALGTDGAASVTLDASDNALTITTAQYNAITGHGIALTAGDFVTLADTGSALTALTAGQLMALSANNVDAIHATDNAVTFTIAQLNALSTATVALTQADTVTMSDTASNIQALTSSQLTGYATQGVDIINATGGTLSMSKAQVGAVVSSTESFAAANTVTLADTGANIAALTTAQFALLAAHGVDIINASDDVLSLTAGQYSGLGATQLTGADTVTLFDTGGHIANLSAAQFGQFAANGIDIIDASNNALTLSLGQYQALGATTLTQTDTVVLKDTGALLGAMTAGQIGGLAAGGIDRIDASDNLLSLSLSQFNALGTVVLTGGDTVTLADTGAALGGLSTAQIGALAGLGIDKLDATDDHLSLNVAQYNSLHHVTLTLADTVTLADTGADISALSATKIGALAANGIDVIDASDNAITFSLAQYNALGAVQLANDDVVTVNGTGATDLIDGRNGSQILNGLGGDDVLFGEAGNDTLDGGLGNDTLNGGTGNDTALYSDATASVTVSLAAGTATGGAGTDLLTSIENVVGSNFNDVLTGDSGNNTLTGGAGNDVLTGGLGADTLYGGTGADHFVFNSIADSPGGGADKIMDFSHAEGDVIDLSGIDAITGGADDAFTLISGGFTHHAGELIVVSAGLNTYSVRGDVNGDGVADFFITVHSTTALVAGDFIL